MRKLLRITGIILRFTKVMILGSFGFWLSAISELLGCACDALRWDNLANGLWKLAQSGNQIMDSQLKAPILKPRHE